nr:glycosyltransferase family 39 protein [bacterium]
MKWSNRLYWTAFVLIFLTAGIMRLHEIDIRPGLEWDETVYYQIARNTLVTGYPSLRSEGFDPDHVYIYHPPIDFLVRAGWLGITGSDDITTLRIMSAAFSLATYAMVFVLAWKVVNRRVALLVLLLMVTDGWLIYTNRLNLIENTQMFWVTIAMVSYFFSQSKKERKWQIISGLLIGWSIVYKHTGIHILAVPIILIVLQPSEWRKHLLVISAATVVCSIYAVVMAASYGDVFIQNTWVQIQRAMGSIDSRGLNFDLSKTLEVIYNTYWVFLTTVATLVISVPVALANLRRWRKGTLGEERIFLAWY